MTRIPTLVEHYEALADRRYPVMLVIQSGESQCPSELTRNAAEQSGASYVDFLEHASSPGSSVRAGAFMRHHFIAWLKEQARESNGIWVDNADTIIVTWTEDERKAFFMEFLRTESRREDGSAVPIVLASVLAGQFNLPEEPRGQGIVVRLQ